MLHKKFKPSKCKTALNLAKSRIKLLKNKKDSQVKQLRRELAQLLQSGQDQTARIRVEHVVREEKMMAAFELIEIFCELVVARLPILESQKDCPLDLKEAVTSLIFAAPRCGDIPELQDVRKHFIAKYGKEFVAAATELHPNCGVSRNLVEKLSVKAPDGPTKVKILAGIAEEHNLKWEPRWFEDENPSPFVEVPKEQHMGKPGKIQMEPLEFEIADNLQLPLADDVGRSNTSQSHPHANSVSEISTSTSHPDGKPESYSYKKVFSHSSGIADDAVEGGSQIWTMKFKDATAAAQAAAESAEQASFAARAAAELARSSTVVSRPLGSSGCGRDQDKDVCGGSVLKDQHVEEHAANGSFNQRTPRMQEDQEGTYQRSNMTKVTEATSVVEDFTEPGLAYKSRKEENHESKNSAYRMYKEVRPSDGSLPTPSSPEAEYDVFEYSRHQKYGNVPVDNPFHDEIAKMKIQPDNFNNQSSSFADEYGIFSNLNDKNKNYSDDSFYGASNYETANNDNWGVKTVYYSGIGDMKVDAQFTDPEEESRISDSGDQKYRSNSGNDIFVSVDDRTNEMGSTEEIEAHTESGAVFDASGSDDDEINLFDPAKRSYVLPSSGKFLPKHYASHKDCESSFSSHPQYGLDVSDSFRESIAKLSEPLPLKFDSDGESSESERELQNETPDPVTLNNNYGKHNTTHPDLGGEHEESRTIYSDTGDSYTRQHSYQHREESHDLDLASVYDVEAKPQNPLPSPNHSQSSNPASQTENEKQAGPEGSMELDLGLLPGGLKNRRMRDPPYRRCELGCVSYSPRSRAGADGSLDSQVSLGQVESKQYFERTSGSYTHFNSTGDDPEVVITRKSSNAEWPYSPKICGSANKTWKDPTGFFNSDDSNSEDDSPKQPALIKNLPGGGVSRRTKGSAIKSAACPQPSTTREHIPGSSSYASEVSSKLQTGTVGPRFRRADNSRLDEPATSGPRPQRKLADNAYGSSSSAAERPMTPSDAQPPRESNSSNEKAPSGENSTKNPAHVHPKLPDFETVAARMQSFRTNRRQ